MAKDEESNSHWYGFVEEVDSDKIKFGKSIITIVTW